MLWHVQRIVPLLRCPCPVIPSLHRRLLSWGTSSPNVAAILSSDPTQSAEKVTAIGWVRTIRKHKRVTFLELGDGSTSQTLHAVLQPSSTEGLSTGASVALHGNWRPAPQGAKQTYELEVTEVDIQGKADETFPIQKKSHSPEFLRTIPHLRLRTPLHSVLTRIKSEADHSISTFFRKQDFVRVQPPIITSSDCEGAGEVFGVTARNVHLEKSKTENPSTVPTFFKSPKYLTVSSQLHLEAFVHEHPKVWCFSPTFRAEKSDTPRHLSEFWMLEAEARTTDLTELMLLAENLIRGLLRGLEDAGLLGELVLARAKTDSNGSGMIVEDITKRWSGIRASSWPRITYDEAVDALSTAATAGRTTFTFLPSADEGLHLEHEKWVVAHFGQGRPVFVTNYPSRSKAFYMSSVDEKKGGNETNEHAACFDLLLPETCEIAGGSLREYRLEVLEQNMHAQNIDAGNLAWYMDLRKYGSVPHGGFGLGLDRLLAYLAGLDNIKDVVTWPRHFGRCDG